MKLEDQLVSLELSRRLKKLGVKNESLFYWFPGESFTYIYCKYYEQYSPHVDLCIKDGYSAYSIAELGEMLFEKNFDNLEKIGYLKINTEIVYGNDGSFYRLTNNFSDHIIDELCEANARAKMLIYLIENNLIKVEDL